MSSRALKVPVSEPDGGASTHHVPTRPLYLVQKIDRVAVKVGVAAPEWDGEDEGLEVLHGLRRQIPDRFRAPRLSCDVERLLGVRRSGFGAESQAELLRNDPCCYCGGILGGWIEVDHIHARAHGGADHWTNYTAACRPCNASKLDTSPLEWLLRLRLLTEGKLDEALEVRIGPQG